MSAPFLAGLGAAVCGDLLAPALLNKGLDAIVIEPLGPERTLDRCCGVGPTAVGAGGVAFISLPLLAGGA